MEKLMVMMKNLTNLGYTYSDISLKKPPDILGIIQRLTHLLDPRGRHRTSRHIMAFSGTNTQESPIKFDTSTGYTLWDSGFNHYINPHFDL